MLESLDAAYAFIRDTPRKRSRMEAHGKLNRAYMDLIFAWGYAQSGNDARSRELLEQARAALPCFNAVHQTVLKSFEARIAERSTSPWTRLEVDLAPLQQLERFRLMRLFEALAILSRVESIAAISHSFREATGAAHLPPPEDRITQLLVADGAGCADEVRALLDQVLASAESNGAVLIGPCRRAGREAELIAMLKRRPAADVDVALQALGLPAADPARFEDLGAHSLRRISNARPLIGALTLSGRTAAAEALAAEAWAEATDSFSTNEEFTLTPLTVCETIVLCTLRHELALGNRSRLEPIPQPIVLPNTTATEEAYDGWMSEAARGMTALASWLEASAQIPGVFQERFDLLNENLRALLRHHSLPIKEAAASAAMTLLDRVQRVESLVQFLGSTIMPQASKAPVWTSEARELISNVAVVLKAFDDRDPEARLGHERVIKALGSVAGCLHSIPVERPAMTPEQLARLATAEEALSHFKDRHAQIDKGWRRSIELPFEELLSSITINLELANREAAALPPDWDPDVLPSVREAVAVVTELLPFLRSL